MNEEELSKKIRDFLNKSYLNYRFRFIDSFCDVADERNKIYIEVKPDHFAPAQILHAFAREGISDATYLGVADSRTLKLYTPPPYEKILEFAKSFDPKFNFTASQVDKPKLNLEADKILGNPVKTVKLEFETSQYFFITKDNMKSVRAMTDKYRIHLDLLVDWLDGVGETDSIKVNKDGWLINTDKPDIFTNETIQQRKDKELAEFGGSRRPKYVSIKPVDISFFESLRIRHDDLAEVLHDVDRLLTRKKRREGGVFWTEAEIADKLADEIIALTKPDYVVEPCVGGGSLIKRMVTHVKGTMNDISVGHVENCKRIYDGFDWKFTTMDVVKTDTEELIREWGVPKDGTLLLYTNPPFGTGATNKLVSKKGEIDDTLSRKQLIVYPAALQKYGKGDLFLPIVGRLIEIAKARKRTWIAFFSPFGLFCGKYTKLAQSLLKEFSFVKGYVFAGNYFHDINHLKPVALSIWEYGAIRPSKLVDLKFEFIDKNGNVKEVKFKELPLLKDGWKYDRRDKGTLKGEIVVQHCESFNAPAPKVIHLNPKQGGSEMIPENVMIPIGVDDLPDELVYGLWSLSVGAKAFWTSLSNMLHPIYFDNAYVHLPDFSKRETVEILALSAIHALLRNYANGKVGFFGTNKVFRFGGERLTKGVEHLFYTCKDCIVYDNYTISEVFNQVKESKVDFARCTKGIKDEVAKRQERIHYWDYVPVPKIIDSEVVGNETQLWYGTGGGDIHPSLR